MRPAQLSQVSPAAAAARSAAAMAQVVAVQQQALVASTQTRITKAIRELQTWCQDVGLSVHTVSPADVLWYMQEHWLPSHAGEFALCLRCCSMLLLCLL